MIGKMLLATLMITSAEAAGLRQMHKPAPRMAQVHHRQPHGQGLAQDDDFPPLDEVEGAVVKAEEAVPSFTFDDVMGLLDNVTETQLQGAWDTVTGGKETIQTAEVVELFGEFMKSLEADDLAATAV